MTAPVTNSSNNILNPFQAYAAYQQKSIVAKICDYTMPMLKRITDIGSKVLAMLAATSVTGKRAIIGTIGGLSIGAVGGAVTGAFAGEPIDGALIGAMPEKALC